MSASDTPIMESLAVWQRKCRGDCWTAWFVGLVFWLFSCIPAYLISLVLAALCSPLLLFCDDRGQQTPHILGSVFALFFLSAYRGTGEAAYQLKLIWAGLFHPWFGLVILAILLSWALIRIACGRWQTEGAGLRFFCGLPDSRGMSFVRQERLYRGHMCGFLYGTVRALFYSPAVRLVEEFRMLRDGLGAVACLPPGAEQVVASLWDVEGGYKWLLEAEQPNLLPLLKRLEEMGVIALQDAGRGWIQVHYTPEFAGVLAKAMRRTSAGRSDAANPLPGVREESVDPEPAREGTRCAVGAGARVDEENAGDRR